MTWIIITLWPAVSTIEKLQNLYDNWVRILRLNFPHADYNWAKNYQNLLAKVVQDVADPFVLMLDTKWPSIRLGDFKWVVAFKKWDKLKLVVDEKIADYQNWVLFCDYKYLLEDSHIGDIIKIDSWLFNVKVLEKNKKYLLVEWLSDGNISSRKHVNLPWVKLRLPAISKEDILDLEFAAKNAFAYVALSFVNSEQDILQVRKTLDETGGQNIKIISKIENASAIDDLDDIIAYSDMVMVARGDLWVELPFEKVPVFQREIIHKCKFYKKPVIVATEMIESMIHHNIPTRAEVNDMFSSVEEWADFLMLSWETAIGKYPIECVKVMQKVISEALIYIK